jgi:hypothetical protein
MKQNLILWMGAVIITFLAGYLQSVTDAEFPISGTIGIDGEKVSYMFHKAASNDSDYMVLIRTEKAGISGIVEWRLTGEKDWTEIEMKKDGNNLLAFIPKQKALQKIDYRVTLEYEGKNYNLIGPTRLTFYGKVHPMISFIFYFTLFGALLLSTRTGLEGFKDNPKLGAYTVFTVIFFFLYTLAVNPLKRSYELGAINNSVPPIHALFDLHSILLFTTWIAGMIVIFKINNKKAAALTTAFVTILIFLLVRF